MTLRLVLVMMISLSYAGFSAGALGHTLPGPSCQAPMRPVDDQNDAIWQAFLNEVDQFRACTARQMEQHEAAVLEHQEGARLAVDAWNDFVRTSLNAPEDFPWPPEDKSS